MTREDQIIEIKRILRDCCEESTNTCELEASSSPCISSTGTNRQNVSVLVERFSVDDVEVVTYLNETEIGEVTMTYEELSDDIIDEIYNLLEQYEIGLEKTFKRCQD